MKQRPAPIFVGDHLAMDFLNSVAMPSGMQTEWLANGIDLIDWLERSGAVVPATVAGFRTGRLQELDAVAGRARVLREWLRGFVRGHSDGVLDADAVVELAPLNRLLATDDSYSQIIEDVVGGPRMQRVGRWTAPGQLLQPVALAIADLVCNEDLRRIRTCEGAVCTLMFLDRTKAHARRWCSMAACGNRAKAAAHRARASCGHG